MVGGGRRREAGCRGGAWERVGWRERFISTTDFGVGDDQGDSVHAVICWLCGRWGVIVVIVYITYMI